MMWLLGLKSKLIGLASILITVLATVVRLKSLKRSKDLYKRKAETLELRLKQEKNIKKIVKEEELQRHSQRVELLKELEKKEKDDGTFEGLDNLSNSNKF